MGMSSGALRRASRQKRRKKSGRKDSQKMFPIHSIRQLWVRQVFNIRCTFRNRGHSPIGQESNNRCLRNSYRIGTSFRRELFFRPAPHRRPLRFRVSPPPNKSVHPSRLVPRICRISRGPPSRDRQYRHRFREMNRKSAIPYLKRLVILDIIARKEMKYIPCIKKRRFFQKMRSEFDCLRFAQIILRK